MTDAEAIKEVVKTTQQLNEEVVKLKELCLEWVDKCNYYRTMAEHHQAKREELERELEQYQWKPIETFDRSMFTLMSTGIPDSTEYVKYKGDVPDWAKLWTRVPPLPRNI